MSKPVLIIGNKNLSSWSLRPWLFLRHARVAFDELLLPLDTAEFTSRVADFSPSRRVPALRHGDLTVWDSLAICEYANEALVGGNGWPADRDERAVARAICAEMHSGFQALRSECPMNLGLRMAEPKALSAEARHNVERVCAIWREVRAKYGEGGDLLFGSFTIADAFFAPVAWRFHSYAIPVGEVERSYMDAIFALPEMREWAAAAERERAL